jgi:hypothetical protein
VDGSLPTRNHFSWKVERMPVSDELRDTFELFGLAARRLSVRWIREADYFAMTRKERSALLRDQVRLGRALVPTVPSVGDAKSAVRDQQTRRDVLGRFVAGNRPASRHSEVQASVWRAAKVRLPSAHRVAGVFPLRSGPNCFGTVKWTK